ncbi:hypothetical protein CAC42_2651 [Sphaceloma murrayae]|uniref:Tyrosine-protein phosphatase SIW14 n=1 Tax=Sphaceloma murrayae TaxID=2082308 RepID=A0A2K1QHG9_9PEZI|nr:hypothetical protein CAC42_2651 [Sphaceloma murrayae]
MASKTMVAIQTKQRTNQQASKSQIASAKRQERSLLMPPPTRLTSFAPPPNFGSIEDHYIVRSAFPRSENYHFLQEIGIKTIVILTGEILSASYLEFMAHNNIKHIQFDMPQNKSGEVHLSAELVTRVLHIVMARATHPILIHCNGGKHRTGCVVACFRKVQWHGNTVAALAEYETFACGKSREGDKRFIEAFDENTCMGVASEQFWV